MEGTETEPNTLGVGNAALSEVLVALNVGAEHGVYMVAAGVGSPEAQPGEEGVLADGGLNRPGFWGFGAGLWRVYAGLRDPREPDPGNDLHQMWARLGA